MPDELRQADTLPVTVSVDDVVALRHRDAVGDIDDVEVAHCDGDDVAQRDDDTLTHAVELGEDESVPLVDPLTLPLEDSDGVALAVELKHSVAVGDMDAVALVQRDCVAEVELLVDAVRVVLNDPLAQPLYDTVGVALSHVVAVDVRQRLEELDPEALGDKLGDSDAETLGD